MFTIRHCLLVLALALAALRAWLLAGREVAAGPTWDCGYARPTARMQYTAASFSEGVADFFGVVLGQRRRTLAPEGWFPTSASFECDTPDAALERGYRPLFRGVLWLLSWLSWIQHGRVGGYVLYIAVTMVALIVWYVL